MNGVFLEFENENALRAYPFAAGGSPIDDLDRSIPTDLFVDAALYPVNPQGTLYLAAILEDGTFTVADNTGVIMTGTATGNIVELYDTTPFERHVGTIVALSASALADFAGRGVARAYSREETAFAASCVFPVIIDGVVSVAIPNTGITTGDVKFSNGPDDAIRVSSGMIGANKSLRFDILPRPAVPDESFIKRVICVVDGQTPFRIHKEYATESSDSSSHDGYGLYNTVILTLDQIDKETVCAAAHREDAYEMADTCECDPPPMPKEDSLPEFYQLEEVFIPPDPDGTEGGVPEGADNAFYLVVPNVLGDGGNPLSITLEDGVAQPRIDPPEANVDGFDVSLADDALIDAVTSKGVVIQVPGLAGGTI